MVINVLQSTTALMVSNFTPIVGQRTLPVTGIAAIRFRNSCDQIKNKGAPDQGEEDSITPDLVENRPTHLLIALAPGAPGKRRDYVLRVAAVY